MTTNVHDVAAAILARTGEISCFKLQKLVYYCQAWATVWIDRPLLAERIEAWANGPVCPDLYHAHKGSFSVSAWPRGNPDVLTVDECETVEVVVNYYSGKTAQWLTDLVCMERPWCVARGRSGVGYPERGSEAILPEEMQEYYASLKDEPTATTSSP